MPQRLMMHLKSILNPLQFMMAAIPFIDAIDIGIRLASAISVVAILIYKTIRFLDDRKQAKIQIEILQEELKAKKKLNK